MRSSNSYLPLGEAIDAFLRKHGLREQAKMQQLIAQWPTLMGNAIAHNTEKMWFNKGTFYVKMKSPVWKQELGMARNRIRQMLNQQLKEEIIQEVRIF